MKSVTLLCPGDGDSRITADQLSELALCEEGLRFNGAALLYDYEQPKISDPRRVPEGESASQNQGQPLIANAQGPEYGDDRQLPLWRGEGEGA